MGKSGNRRTRIWNKSNESTSNEKYDTAILAVAHKEFTELDILSMLNDNHIIYDVKDSLTNK